jgi:predicted metalloprotease with PDZ domain
MAKFAFVLLITLAIGPQLTWAAPIPGPIEDSYPGTIDLAVDATDINHKIVSVEETIPVKTGALVLLYPQWGPGRHSPFRNLVSFAGLKLSAQGKAISWKRDLEDMFAFHLTVPPGVGEIKAEFRYLTAIAPAPGRQEISNNILDLQFTSLVLYPAGYNMDGIQITAAVRLPDGWKSATALEPSGANGSVIRYRKTDLTTLVDSPLMAGSHFKQFDLAPGAAIPVHFDVFAETEEDLETSDAAIAGLRRLIQQAYTLFGPPPYDHYDFLVGVSARIGDIALEHLRSTEIVHEPKHFKKFVTSAVANYSESHEFVHAWNGKFRRPADLTTPNLNVPMQNSLLWVYEGQTQYWGNVLASRAKLRNEELVRESLAYDFAFKLEGRVGREWRDLEDTLNDEIISERSPRNWRSWQRAIDYYDEGTIIWLGIDARIRSLTNDKKSLDDFAAVFFDVSKSERRPYVYDFDDVVRTLNQMAPFDWAMHLQNRLTAHDDRGLREDIAVAGWKLVYTSKRNSVEDDANSDKCNAYWSLGISIDKDSVIDSINWNSPAFNAGLRVGGTVLAVDGRVYSCDVLASEIGAHEGKETPIILIVRSEDLVKIVNLTYSGGVRYPHLERIADIPDRLTAIFSPR